MRIIAGEARGRKLKSIKSKNTRPTLDRVKEAIFNMIGPDIFGISGLDLFAGFGNLGLEAISRGADRIIFVENYFKNVKIIKENIILCGFTDRAEVVNEDVFSFLQRIKKEFGLILMDPPYNKGLVKKSLSLIEEYNVIAPEGIVVAEHKASESIDDDTLSLLKIIKNKKYGDTGVTILQARG